MMAPVLENPTPTGNKTRWKGTKQAGVNNLSARYFFLSVYRPTSHREPCQ